MKRIRFVSDLASFLRHGEIRINCIRGLYFKATFLPYWVDTRLQSCSVESQRGIKHLLLLLESSLVGMVKGTEEDIEIMAIGDRLFPHNLAWNCVTPLEYIAQRATIRINRISRGVLVDAIGIEPPSNDAFPGPYGASVEAPSIVVGLKRLYKTPFVPVQFRISPLRKVPIVKAKKSGS